MFCTSCGKQIAQNLRICPYCGAAAANNQANKNGGYYNNPAYNRQAPPSGTAAQSSGNQAQPQAAYNNYSTQQGGMPVSIGGWIGRSLIPCIPFVGWIVYLIMLFIWSGDMTKEETFRNWAKAQLVVMAIIIGIFLLIFILLMVTGGIAALTSSMSSNYYY